MHVVRISRRSLILLALGPLLNSCLINISPATQTETIRGTHKKRRVQWRFTPKLTVPFLLSPSLFLFSLFSSFFVSLSLFLSLSFVQYSRALLDLNPQPEVVNFLCDLPFPSAREAVALSLPSLDVLECLLEAFLGRCECE